jgi:small-conductance mechanosensitive channel
VPLATLLLAQTESARSPSERACGSDPTEICSWLIGELQGNVWLTIAIDRILMVPVILVVAFVLYRLWRRWTKRFVASVEEDIRRRLQRARELHTRAATRSAETRRLQRLHAIGGAIGSGGGVVIWLTAIILILDRFFDLGPLLAGAGLAGLVVGFGAQNMIRDFLAGISMLVEDQFGVGDWIQVDDSAGEVEQVGLRTTRIRDIDGVVWHIPNGHMQKVGNLTQHWARATLDVPFSLDADIAHVRRVVQAVADDLAEDPDWGQDIIAAPEIWGVQRWGPDGLALRLAIPTRPLRNWDVNRQMRERLHYAFAHEGIRMPAEMLEVGAQRTGSPVRHTAVDPDEEEPIGGEAARGSWPPVSPSEADFELPADLTQRIPTVRPVQPDDETSVDAHPDAEGGASGGTAGGDGGE